MSLPFDAANVRRAEFVRHCHVNVIDLEEHDAFCQDLRRDAIARTYEDMPQRGAM